MVYPKKNIFIRGFFSKYIPWIIHRSFKRVGFNAIGIDEGKSVLLLANHFSWWDAFLMYYVFSKLTDKQFYVMVSEDNMKQQTFFKYIGAFSINKSPHQIITSLNYAAQLLNNPQNLVLIFPQGKLKSNFINNVDFEKGALRIMQQAADKFQLIYSTSFIEHLQHKKPTVNVYLTTETNCTFDAIEALNSSYQQHYDASRQQQTQIVL